jgi:adenylate cyclase
MGEQAGGPQNEALWRAMLSGRHLALRQGRRLFRLLPRAPRCRFCYAPFAGPGAPLMRLIGRQPWRKNPYWCSGCERYVRDFPGGAEMEAAFVFADVRGSTGLAEGMRAAEFGQLMQRFYSVATRILTDSDAIIDKLVGDEVIGIYLPGLAGQGYARRAIATSREILRATGHDDRRGPWLPVGIGVHAGRAYIGSIGSADGVTDLTALGDTVNIAARLAAVAGAGEIILSEPARAAAGVALPGIEPRQLELKGHQQPVEVRILSAGHPAAAAL